jgi:hypothetical protein
MSAMATNNKAGVRRRVMLVCTENLACEDEDAVEADDEDDTEERER